MRRSAPWIVALAALMLLASSGCSDRRDAQRLEVFAASSLTEVFTELTEQFVAREPGVDVRLTFAGSQVLRLQLEQGASADVLASANEQHMQALVDHGIVEQSTTFAENELIVIVPRDNPARIETFEDLAGAQRLVIGTESVPVGAYSRRALERSEPVFGADFVATLRQNVVSEETNVRLVRAKVELGEADAAIVYRTDAMASDRVRVVPIPTSVNVRARYPIAVVHDALNRPDAERFRAFVLSDEGRRTLRAHGFGVDAP